MGDAQCLALMAGDYDMMNLHHLDHFFGCYSLMLEGRIIPNEAGNLLWLLVDIDSMTS